MRTIAFRVRSPAFRPFSKSRHRVRGSSNGNRVENAVAAADYYASARPSFFRNGFNRAYNGSGVFTYLPEGTGGARVATGRRCGFIAVPSHGWEIERGYAKNFDQSVGGVAAFCVLNLNTRNTRNRLILIVYFSRWIFRRHNCDVYLPQ